MEFEVIIGRTKAHDGRALEYMRTVSGEIETARNNRTGLEKVGGV